MDADLCKPRDGSAKAAIFAPMKAGVSNGGQGGSTSRANRAGVGIILAMSPQGNLWVFIACDACMCHATGLIFIFTLMKQ